VRLNRDIKKKTEKKMKIKHMAAVRVNKLQHRPMIKHKTSEECITVMATVFAVWFLSFV
jgi:hypothetical protein